MYDISARIPLSEITAFQGVFTSTAAVFRTPKPSHAAYNRLVAANFDIEFEISIKACIR
jgi:hypothetical protein